MLSANVSVVVALAMLALFGIGMLAISEIATRPGTPFSWPSPTRLTQVLLAFLGFVALALHVFPTIRRPDEDYPNVDVIALGCVGIIGLAAFLPRVKSLKLFGGNELVVDEGKMAVDGYETSVASITALLERWASTIGTLYANVQNASSTVEILQTERRFFRDRLGEIKQFVVDSDKSPVRVAVWLLDETGKRLEFDFSNEIEDDATMAASLEIGQGMVGQCFAEQGTLNVADAQSLASYVPIHAPVRYRAVLVTPITVDGVKLGVLTMDKAAETTFSPQAATVAKAAAALIAACEAFVATRIDEMRASRQNGA